MLLLIIDDTNTFAKKELYSETLSVGGILHANSIKEAEEILEEKNQVDLLLINNILIEDIDYNIDELKKLHDKFSGAILLKVTDEKVGLKLIKMGLVTEYYLSDDNKEKELANLQEGLKLASIRREISKSITACNYGLKQCKKYLNLVR